MRKLKILGKTATCLLLAAVLLFANIVPAPPAKANPLVLPALEELLALVMSYVLVAGVGMEFQSRAELDAATDYMLEKINVDPDTASSWTKLEAKIASYVIPALGETLYSWYAGYQEPVFPDPVPGAPPADIGVPLNLVDLFGEAAYNELVGTARDAFSIPDWEEGVVSGLVKSLPYPEAVGISDYVVDGHPVFLGWDGVSSLGGSMFSNPIPYTVDKIDQLKPYFFEIPRDENGKYSFSFSSPLRTNNGLKSNPAIDYIETYNFTYMPSASIPVFKITGRNTAGAVKSMDDLALSNSGSWDYTGKFFYVLGANNWYDSNYIPGYSLILCCLIARGNVSNPTETAYYSTKLAEIAPQDIGQLKKSMTLDTTIPQYKGQDIAFKPNSNSLVNVSASSLYPVVNLTENCLSYLDHYVAQISDVLDNGGLTDQDYREAMERAREAMNRMKERIAGGGVGADLLQRLWEILQRMRGRELDAYPDSATAGTKAGSLPQIVTDELTRLLELDEEMEGVGEQVGTDNPAIPKEGMENPSIPKSNRFVTVFPFCLPFDLIEMISLLKCEPKAPEFVIPFEWPGVFTEEIRVSFDFLNPIMPLVRMLFLLGFAVGLIKLTSTVIKW